MRRISLAHLNDGSLLSGLKSLVARGCIWTAELLAYLAEVEARRLYAPAGYSSMYMYCVQELHFSEQVALKHLRTARMARRFPAILDAVAEGRVHVSGLLLIKPHMTRQTADELLTAITHKTCREIELFLAHRFPQPDVPTRIMPIAVARSAQPVVPNPLVASMPDESPVQPVATVWIETPTSQLSARTVRVISEVSQPIGMADIQQAVAEPYPRITPLAPGRFAVTFTMGQAMHDKLQHAQELLGFDVPSADLPAVLERALDALNAKLEKAKCAATVHPQDARRPARDDRRHIPARVKRAVRKRDGGQCTFVSDSGKRCTERKGLEYDHVEPFTRGGRANEAGVRLLCRAHNQMEAERVFGREFMAGKRRAAQEARSAAQTAMRAVEAMCAESTAALGVARPAPVRAG